MSGAGLSAATQSGNGVRYWARAVCQALFMCVVFPGWVDAQAQVGLVDRAAALEVRDAQLIDALRLLQVRSGARIAFSPELIRSDSVVSCICMGSTVGEALDRLLTGTDLTFVERRGQILVAPAGARPEDPDLGALVGIVRDTGGVPVSSARVEIGETGLATLTGPDGRFTLGPLPPGRYHLAVDALGFRAVATRPADVAAGAPTPVGVALERDPLALAEIVVAPGTFGMLEEVALQPQALTREEMDALPQLGEDVFRVMERMPGVATDDISARLNVRGGNDDELLILLDGTELFEPYHMRDLDAILGVVDVGALGGVNLVAGGLPTEHGDRMSGLLDMRTQHTVGRRARSSVGLSVSNITARTQGSFSEGRGGWLVSGRRGFLDLVLALSAKTDGSEANDDLAPRYYDVMAKVEYLVGAKHRFRVNALIAGDDLNLSEVVPPFERASLGTDWRNLNLWSGWDWAPSPSADVTTVLSYNQLSRRRTGEWISPGSSEVADFADVLDRGDFSFATLRQDWRAALRPSAVLKFGGQVRLANATYRYSNLAGRERVDSSGGIGVLYDTTLVTLDPSATESSAYLAARLQPVERLTLEVGGRYDHRTHTGDADLSPRLQGALRVGTATHIRGSWGVYRQSHGVEELSAVDGDTTFFGSEAARQLAIGVEHRFGVGLEARAEAYLRTTSDPRPRYLNVGREIIPFPEIGNDRVRFHPDEGRARGIEFLLSGTLGRRSEWSATYVLASAEDRVGNTWIPRTLDQRHTAGLRWRGDLSEVWQLSAGWQYHTGWPSTPMEFDVDTLSADPNGRSVLINERPGALNSRRLPAYHRMDLRATRSFDVGQGQIHVFLDVFNLYNRRNLRSFDYKVELPSGRAIANEGETLLPLLPSFGFTWEF